MTNRPPRQAEPNPLLAWDTQAPQYDRPDVTVPPGERVVTRWTAPASEVPIPIECLLAWENGALVGILNYFPEGSPFGEQPGDFFVIVNPEKRRSGIGTALVFGARIHWQVELLKQSYTDEGWALASVLVGDPMFA